MSCVEQYMNGDKLETRPCVNAELETLASNCLAGTELKVLLSKIGITSNSNCSCDKRASEMNNNGCDWCENNIDTIVGWLREEAHKRNLPFIDMAGKILVKKAIKNARKNQKK